MDGGDQKLWFSCISLAIQTMRSSGNADLDVVEMAGRIFAFVKSEASPKPEAGELKTLAQWAGLADEAPAA